MFLDPSVITSTFTLPPPHTHTHLLVSASWLNKRWLRFLSGKKSDLNITYGIKKQLEKKKKRLQF